MAYYGYYPMNNITNKKLGRALVYGGLFIAGALTGWIFFRMTTDISSNSSNGVRQSGYTFISPLLECDVADGQTTKPLRSLQNDLEEYSDSVIASSSVDHISIYLRDLNNGPWIGVYEEEVFTPASLLKVPVMMTYFRAAESDPDLLDEELTYQPETPPSETATLKSGESYSIDQLIKYMIRDSDNDAFSLLVSHIDNDLVNKTLVDLGLTVPDASTPENYITVRSYASLFRVLYNASYLSRDMSERALELLSSTSYNDGLRAGIGDGVIVASKFGIRGNQNNADRQLHDCGIVYYPNHPYLICVMTRGSEIGELATTIANISKRIFDFHLEAYPIE